MKKLLTQYTSMTRTERMGYGAFTSFLLLLIAVKSMMPMFIHPAGKFQRDEKLEAAWARIKAATPPDHPHWQKDTINTALALFAFDPNTVDSNGLMALGFTPRLAHGLMNWRAHGKHFYKKEELQKLYNMPPEFYSRLAPYISIAPGGAGNPYPAYANNYQPWPEAAPAPEMVELNTVDSATLVRIRGIGAYTAHKIIERRQALGGFLRKDQLREIYGLRDTLLQTLEAHTTVDAKKAHRFNLNAVTLEQLKAHPYVGEKMAQYILMYRDGLKGYKSVEQLRQAPMMDEEKYRKIAPYFTVE